MTLKLYGSRSIPMPRAGSGSVKDALRGVAPLPLAIGLSRAPVPRVGSTFGVGADCAGQHRINGPADVTHLGCGWFASP